MKNRVEKIDQITFTTEVFLETSFNRRSIGQRLNTMTLFALEAQYIIEWEIEDYGVEQIGIWTRHRQLSDYDGVFILPAEAITLLERNGIKVGPDFRDD